MADSPCTGKPSARASALTWAARALADALGMVTTDVRRRKAPRPQRAAEPRRATSGQDVVRARRVVAERRRAALPDEHAARDSRPGGGLVGALEGELEVLGGHRVRERQRRLEPAGGDQGERRLGDAGPLRRELGDQLRYPVEERGVRRGHDQRAVGAVLGLRAEVERDPIRVRGPVGDHHQLAGPSDPVDPDLRPRPVAWPR